MKKQVKKFNDIKPFERDHFLDFLKMICILFVITHHIFYYLYWTQSMNAGRMITTFFGENFGFQYYIYQAVPIFMVISGYVWAKSYERAKCEKLWHCYKPYFLLKKFTRLFVPFLVFFFMCLLTAKVATNTLFSSSNWLVMFFTGGPIEDFAPTSAYYVVLTFSMLIVMPLIWIVVKKLGIWGFAICYGFNILYEVIVWASGMDGFPYQFIIFRYTALLAYGIYLAYHKDKKPIFWLIPIAFAIGVTFLSLYYYGPIAESLQDKFVVWGWSNILTFPYTIAIMAILVRYCHLKNKWFGVIGSKTWSIFLMQTYIFAFTLWAGQTVGTGIWKYKAVSPFVFSNDLAGQSFITLGLIAALSIAFYVLIEWLATGNLIKLMDKKHKAWLQNRK